MIAACERARRVVAIVVMATVLAPLVGSTGCVRAIRPATPSREWSGFLDDYSRLRLGEPGDLPFVYRNPKADWKAYDKVLFEPVTLWRSGRDALAAVPEADLLHLVSRFEAVVRARLGRGFRVVTEPEPGTLRLRLAITAARASDPVVDVLTASPDEDDAGGDAGALSAELAAFVDAAAIEGEIRDAESDELLAQGIDRRAQGAPPRLPTWDALDRALVFWADRVCARLEARTGR